MNENSPLSPEQASSLTEAQKEIFQQLDLKDQAFFAQNFSAQALGKALERKGALVKKKADRSFDQRYQKNLEEAHRSLALEGRGAGVGEMAAGVAGAAGVIGLGSLAAKLAPEGMARWRGVAPKDLTAALNNVFLGAEKTDLRFAPADGEGNLHAQVLLRTANGLKPGLDIVLTALADSTQVHISKVKAESVSEKVKEGGKKLIDLVRRGKSRKDSGDLLGLAGDVLEQGTDIFQSVKDLNLEDQAWEAIQQAAEPLQAIYDEKMAREKEKRHLLQQAWDDFRNCPRCRVPFGAQDQECRVCGTARPAQPAEGEPA